MERKWRLLREQNGYALWVLEGDPNVGTVTGISRERWCVYSAMPGDNPARGGGDGWLVSLTGGSTMWHLPTLWGMPGEFSGDW